MNRESTGRILVINGAELYVEEHGAGAPLVLIHGGLGSGVEWSPVRRLLASQFRVITPDSRGHGRSTNPSGRLSFPAIADDIAALIGSLELDRPVVAGWSDGGQVALELAVRHPGVVGAIIVGGAYPDFAGSGLREVHRELLGADRAGVPDLHHLDIELGEQAHEVKAQHRGGQHHWASLIEQTASMWLDYSGLKPVELATIEQPALVLAGDRDQFIPLDLSIVLYRTLPHAELAVTPQADHGTPFTPERAPEFAGIIADFAHRHPSSVPPRRHSMLTHKHAYNGLAVHDMREARQFYGETLGLTTSEEYGLMWLHLAGGRDTLVYEQPTAVPASFTIINFEVDDIDAIVDTLVAQGVRFERYDGMEQDDRGVFRGEGPSIAWFKDPSGNVLSVLQEK